MAISMHVYLALATEPGALPTRATWVDGATGEAEWDDGVATNDGYQWSAFRRGFVEVSPYVRSISTHRGRAAGSEVFGAASATIQLVNEYGEWTVPGAAPVGAIDLDLGIDVYITVGVDPIEDRVWAGRVREIREVFGVGGESYVDLVCSGPLAELAQVELSSGALWFDGSATDAAVDAVLDAAGWPPDFGAQTSRIIDTGEFTLQAADVEGSAATDVLRSIADAEGGAVFDDEFGRVVFKSRDWLTDTEGDTADLVIGVEIATRDLDLRSIAPITRSVDRIVNTVNFKRAGQSTGVVDSDAESQSKYGKRELQKADFICETDAQVAVLASRVIDYRANVIRSLRSVSVRPVGSQSRDAVLADIGDVVDIEYVHPVHGWTFQEKAHLVGVSHSIDLSGTWEVTFVLDALYQQS